MDIFFGAILWGAVLWFLAHSSEDTKRGLLLWSWILMLVATLVGLLFQLLHMVVEGPHLGLYLLIDYIDPVL